MTLVYFVLLLGGLIFFHELGHFLFARWMGVRVVTFSIGFGPSLFTLKGRPKKLKDKEGNVIGEIPPTEYVIAALPLGGYVKMLGHDPSEDVPDRERLVSFAHKPIWRRFLIVSAGPVFNLILPFIIFFFMYLTHSTVESSVAGSVIPDSPAWSVGIRPGDRIVEIDGEPVEYFWQLQEQIEGRPGETFPISWEHRGERKSANITPVHHKKTVIAKLGVAEEVGIIGISHDYARAVVAVEKGSPAAEAGLGNGDRVINVNGTPVERFDELQAAIEGLGEEPAVLKVLRYGEAPVKNLRVGIGTVETVTVQPGSQPMRGIVSAEFVVESVLAGSPAETMGLRPGDRILGVDDKTFALWSGMRRHISIHRKEGQRLYWVRDGKEMSEEIKLVDVTVKRDLDPEHQLEVFGANSLGETAQLAPIDNEDVWAYAAYFSVDRSEYAIWLTGATIAGLIRGDVSTKELGGPVLIGQLAARTNEHGWGYFFQLMAFLSVNLGLINLLPIPLFDGGHLVFLAYEAIRRRPASLRFRQISAYIGFAFIIVLMAYVLVNDLNRSM